MREPTPETLGATTAWPADQWQDAYNALGQRPDWPATARWLTSTGPAMWPTIAAALRDSGERLDLPPRYAGLLPPAGGVLSLLGQLVRAYVRRALVRARLRARGSRDDRGAISAGRMATGALVAIAVVIAYAVSQGKPLTAPTQPWPTATPTSEPVERTYVVEFAARGARITYASINGEQTPSRSIYTLRAPAALVLTVQGTDPRAAGSCMIVVDGQVAVEQHANEGNPATCVWLLEDTGER